MGKLTLTELTSTKLKDSIVNTISAIEGGTAEYCHNGTYTKPDPSGERCQGTPGCDRLTNYN